MIKLLKTNDEFGLKLFRFIEISIAKNKGLTTNTYTVLVGLFSCFLAINIGRETRDGKKTKQKLKESKGYDAFA